MSAVILAGAWAESNPRHKLLPHTLEAPVHGCEGEEKPVVHGLARSSQLGGPKPRFTHVCKVTGGIRGVRYCTLMKHIKISVQLGEGLSVIFRVHKQTRDVVWLDVD